MLLSNKCLAFATRSRETIDVITYGVVKDGFMGFDYLSSNKNTRREYKAGMAICFADFWRQDDGTERGSIKNGDFQVTPLVKCFIFVGLSARRQYGGTKAQLLTFLMIKKNSPKMRYFISKSFTTPSASLLCNQWEEKEGKTGYC